MLRAGLLQILPWLLPWTQAAIQRMWSLANADTKDNRHKWIEKNNFFLFTKKKKIQILDAVNKIHNLFPLALIQTCQFLRVHSPSTPFLPVTQSKVEIFQEWPKVQLAEIGCLRADNGWREAGKRASRQSLLYSAKLLQQVSPSYLDIFQHCTFIMYFVSRPLLQYYTEILS